ncbi:DUF3307 domain-containing protein [Aliivibrio fischeri]|uniref:DUF3307 domain-containing protein n=1 Tax=Aliivibrio fischeri TaxID=668 RepID=UPI0020B3B15C|nr:DUF3307 domain-containing protein [Aliivibrio fischeri]
MAKFALSCKPFFLMHIICDFYLQPKQWVESKKESTYRSPELYLHSLLHGIALLVPVLILDIDWFNVISGYHYIARNLNITWFRC